MRLPTLTLGLALLACGPGPGDLGGAGFGGAITGSDGTADDSNGSTGGGSSTSTGGSPATGGSGGTDTTSGGTGGATGGSGGTATGGTSSGGTGGITGDTGGTGGTGGATLDVCDPPELQPLETNEHVGDDIHNLCGWTWETAPDGYVQSQTSELDCNSLSDGMVRTLATEEDGIWRSSYVSLIDPSERCSEDPMLSVDRRFSVEAGYCMRLTTPFEREAEISADCLIAVPPNDYSGVEFAVKMAEPSWVRIDAAALVDGACPLTCD